MSLVVSICFLNSNSNTDCNSYIAFHLFRFESCRLFKNSCRVQTAVHRGAFCQFPFGWVYYYGSNKSIERKLAKHTSAVQCRLEKQMALDFV